MDVTLSRAKFEDLIRDLVDSTLEPVRQALKDAKIKKEDIMSGVDIQEGFEDLQPTVNANTVGEALGALLALGYSEKEAETALKQVDKTASLEDIIKDCLKVLMG